MFCVRNKISSALVQFLSEKMYGEGGVDISNKTYRLKEYKKVFVANEAVDWLIENASSFCETRKAAGLLLLYY